MKGKEIGGKKYFRPIQEQFRYIHFLIIELRCALSAYLEVFTPHFRHFSNGKISVTIRLMTFNC
jgi:hypothetical protein